VFIGAECIAALCRMDVWQCTVPCQLCPCHILYNGSSHDSHWREVQKYAKFTLLVLQVWLGLFIILVSKFTAFCCYQRACVPVEREHIPIGHHMFTYWLFSSGLGTR